MSSPTEVPTLLRSTTPLRLPSLPMRIFLPHRRRRHLKFRPPSPSPALRRGPEVIPFSNPKSLLPLLCARPWIQSWLLLAVLSPVITMLLAHSICSGTGMLHPAHPRLGFPCVACDQPRASNDCPLEFPLAVFGRPDSLAF